MPLSDLPERREERPQTMPLDPSESIVRCAGRDDDVRLVSDGSDNLV